MKLPTLIYYCCCGLFGVMMSVCGYSITDLPFWVGMTLIITSHICGKESCN